MTGCETRLQQRPEQLQRRGGGVVGARDGHEAAVQAVRSGVRQAAVKDGLAERRGRELARAGVRPGLDCIRQRQLSSAHLSCE